VALAIKCLYAPAEPRDGAKLPILKRADDGPLVAVEEFGWCCAVSDLVAEHAAEHPPMSAP
jgi:hypothetical protein